MSAHRQINGDLHLPAVPGWHQIRPVWWNQFKLQELLCRLIKQYTIVTVITAPPAQLYDVGGYYQNAAGSDACKKCVKGTYVRPEDAPGKHAGDCHVCPKGTDTGRHAGSRACRCLDNYYRTDRFDECFQCPDDGVNCSQDHQFLLPGFWWSWSFTGRYSEQHLPDYLQFVDNLLYEGEDVNLSSSSFVGNLPAAHRCPYKDSCQGHINDSEICSKGYEGPLCATCRKGFFQWFDSCIECPPLWRSLVQIFIVVALFVFLLFLLHIAERQRNLTASGRTVVDHIASKTKILVGFGQVMAALISVLSYVPWPSVMRYLGAKLRLVELNVIEIASPSCLTDLFRVNALQRPLINITAQVIIIFFLFAYYQLRYQVIYRCCRKKQKKGGDEVSEARRSCFRNSWWILFICYPGCAGDILNTLPVKLLACKELCLSHSDSDSSCIQSLSLLKADLTLECDYTKQQWLWRLCWAALSYVIILPILLVYSLYRRHRFNSTLPDTDEELLLLPRGDTDQEKSPTRHRSTNSYSDFLQSLEFLDENYEKKYWYWEAVELLRKLLLTSAVVYFGRMTKSGVAITALIANLFLLLHSVCKPIRRKSEHVLQLLSLLVISLNLMMGTLVQINHPSNPDDFNTSNDTTAFSVVVLLVNCLFVLYLTGKSHIYTNECLCYIGMLMVTGKFARSMYRAIKLTRSNKGRCSIISFLLYCCEEA